MKQYRFPDFRQALAFVNRVGELAEEEGHHPDIELGWGRVKLTLWTHSIGGLSENDFILAAKNGAEVSDTIKYPTPNGAALALMPAAYRDNPVIYPPRSVMARCEYADFEGLARAHLYDETVTRIFAA